MPLYSPASDRESALRGVIPPKVLSIFFDDAYDDVINDFYPLMNNYGFRAVVGLVHDYIGASGRLTWGNVATLIKKGWEIASHSRHHTNFADDTDEIALEDEIYGSLWALRRQGVLTTLKYELCTYIFPYDKASTNMFNIARKYYRAAIVGERIPLTNSNLLDGTIKTILDELKNCGGWRGIYLHSTGDISTDNFETFLKMVKNRKINVLTLDEFIGRYHPYQKPRVEPRTKQIFTNVYESGTDSLNISAIKCAKPLFQVINGMDVAASIQMKGAMYQLSTTVTWFDIDAAISIAAGASQIFEPTIKADFYKLTLSQTGRTTGYVNAWVTLGPP